MARIYLAAPAALLVLEDGGGRVEVRPRLEGRSAGCVTLDPRHPERVWCGTDQGVWRSDDAGETWQATTGAVAEMVVSAVAVSPTERAGDRGVVYAGTDPTTLHRSEDGGATWEPLNELLGLQSAPTWSFPPRPDTSHVRWITPDPQVEGMVSVCIEAGALVRSTDGGRTWRDRLPDGPYDTHTLVAHPAVPERLCSAAGDGLFDPARGFSVSHDRGDTWEHPHEGLEHFYLWGAAVDSGDPDVVLVSAAASPQAAHNAAIAESYVYRREGAGPWRRVSAGLPEAKGTTATVLAAHPTRPGVFYAGSNRGVFRSDDAGETWTSLDVTPPAGVPDWRVAALTVTD